MKRAFISGITGQDGAYLAERLIKLGVDVIGGVRRTSSAIPHRLIELGIADHIKMVEFDLSDRANITRIILEHKPDHFYNLAAQSFVPTSWALPTYTSEINAMGTLHILEAIRNHSQSTRFYQAGTSEMFGSVKSVPQDENTPFSPRSPYGVSKVFAHWITKNYRESYGLFASSGILFNHESPLRGIEFVSRKISLGFAKIANNEQQELVLGNLDAKRDWGFAGDYVEGMVKMLESDTADDFVLATGISITVKDFVDFIANAADIQLEWSGSDVNMVGRNKANGKVLVRCDESYYRPAEVHALIGSALKAKTELGWSPKVNVEQLTEMMFAKDFDRVRSKRLFF